MECQYRASIPTNENSKFAFEWISGSYPSKISIASSLNENNQSGNSLLVPLFPPPPPPLNRDSSLNHSIILNNPGKTTLRIPYRAVTISGKVWLDENGNGQEDQGESGYNAAQLFLDSNGNFNWIRTKHALIESKRKLQTGYSSWTTFDLHCQVILMQTYSSQWKKSVFYIGRI